MAPCRAGTVGVRPPGATSFIAATSSEPTAEIRPIGTLGVAYASGLQSRASSPEPLRLKKPMPARISAAPADSVKLRTASCSASQRVLLEPLTARLIDCDRSMIMNTSTGTASASTETPLHASSAAAPAWAPLASAPAWASALRSIGKPLQASPGMTVLPGPALLLAAPAVVALPAAPAEAVALGAPPALERAPATAPGLRSTVLPTGSLQAMPTKTSNAANEAIEFERLRMFSSLHGRATKDDVDAARAFALDAFAGVSGQHQGSWRVTANVPAGTLVERYDVTIDRDVDERFGRRHRADIDVARPH